VTQLTVQESTLIGGKSPVATGGCVCHVVKTGDLSEDVRAVTSEPHCLLVKLETTSPLNVGELARARAKGIDQHIVERSDGSLCSMLSINDMLWCDRKSFMNAMPRFRIKLPVLYVEEEQCTLVVYPFCFFGEYARIRSMDRRLVDTYLLKTDADGDFCEKWAWDGAEMVRPLIIEIEDSTCASHELILQA
jgi:hypothetical protein